MTLPSSTVRGQYEVLEKIGEGGMGSVYKVKHRLLGDLRVVKTLRPHLMADDTLRRRFEKEARWATRLQHPNIARLYDYAVDEDGTAYIVLELIRGLTLEALLDRGERPSTAFALELVRQALRALSHLHRHRVVHRDISPDNLMLGRDVDGQPELKLIDLGLAKTLEGGEDLTASGHFVGKLRYAAPELLAEASQDRVGPWTDLYALSLVLYELLTGRFPIRGDGASSLIAGHLFRAPIPFDESDAEGRVPEDVRAAVLRGLAKEPSERFANAEEMLDHLDAIGPRWDPGARDVVELLERVVAGSAPTPRQRTEGSTLHRIEGRFAAEEIEEESRETVRPQGELPTVPLDASGLERAQRRARVASAVANIESAIERGDLEEARRAITAALEQDPESDRLRELSTRIEEIARIAFREQVQDLLRTARELAAEDQYEAALASLETARSLLPADRQVLGLLEEVHREAREHRAAADRRRAIDERARKIGGFLEAGELEDARQHLDRATEAYRDDPRWEELARDLRERETEGRRREIGRRMADARRLLEQQQVDAALDALDSVLELEPTHEEAERIRQRLIESSRPSEADLRREIEELLAGEELDRAARRLEQIEAGGAVPAATVAELRNRLAAVRQRVETEMRLAEEVGALLAGDSGVVLPPPTIDRDRRRADALLERARHRAGLEDWATARELLERAREVAPDHPQVAVLAQRLDAMERAREREQRQEAVFATALEQIRGHLEGGRARQAARELEMATRRFGDRQELRELRWRAVEVRLEEESSLDAVQDLSDTIIRRVVERSGVDSLPMAVAQVEGLRRVGQLDDARLALRRARERFGPAPALVQLEAALNRPAPSHPAPPAPTRPRPRTVIAPRPAARPAARRRPWGWIGAGVAVVVLSAALGIWQGRQSQAPATGEVALRMAPESAAAATIVGVSGEQWEAELPSSTQLPTRFPLAEGTWDIRLRIEATPSGGLAQRAEVRVEVAANRLVTVVLAEDGSVVERFTQELALSTL